MALSCSGCNTGIYIVSVSAPPTQSTTSGAGQIGNTFTFKANSTIGGSGSGTITGGCSGAATVGSNCIDLGFSINTTGTYGTTASLATCGANVMQGTATLGNPPNGYCTDSGIGGIVRTFRIGTSQLMGSGANILPIGDVYDDGLDPINALFLQSGAFTCNIVATTVVQCVKGPAYAEGLPSGLGQWMAQTWAGANVSSATYNSSTGDLALTFASAPFGAGVGSTLNGAVINVTGLAGTGSVASLNRQWVITSTATGGTVIHLGANAGLTLTITASTGAIDAGTGTFVSYGDTAYATGRNGSIMGSVGGQSLAFTPTSAGTTGTVAVTATSCGTGSPFSAPVMDVTVQGGVIVDVYPSGKVTATTNAGFGITSNACAFSTGVTGGSVTVPLAFGPNEGQGGIGTTSSDANMQRRSALRQLWRERQSVVQRLRQSGQGQLQLFRTGLAGEDMGSGARIAGQRGHSWDRRIASCCGWFGTLVAGQMVWIIYV